MPPPRRIETSHRYAISALPQEWLIGFYPAESFEGREFRWSGPAAALEIPLATGEYEVTVETGRFRPWPGSLRWSIDGTEIPPDRIEYGADSCRLRISVPRLHRPARRTLSLSCLPWDVADPRRLGLPVFGIEIRQVDAASAQHDVATAPDLPETAGKIAASLARRAA